MSRLIHRYGSRTEETLQSASGRICGVRTSIIWHFKHGPSGGKDRVIQRKESSYIPLVRYLLIFLVAISGRKVAWNLKLFGTTRMDDLFSRRNRDDQSA